MRIAKPICLLIGERAVEPHIEHKKQMHSQEDPNFFEKIASE